VSGQVADPVWLNKEIDSSQYQGSSIDSWEDQEQGGIED
jgi:hypothetical protein